MDTDHYKYMQLALDEAKKGRLEDEVPVGAVLVDAEGKLLAKGYNQTISTCDPTAHAEIVVLRKAAQILGNYRLLSTTLYVTVEPCVMCMGAIIHARIERVVFGAPDPKWGAAGSLYDFSMNRRFNHHPEIISGVCFEQCRTCMRDFFRSKR
ncbi:MAG: tRNA adenosine(34) deaminase TadA [Desulfobacteraceae bacterium]|nr:tRNA adenosine(34) deaminase TadA [Desulfobacteraceae bacterium]